jgi:hypothetical protein
VGEVGSVGSVLCTVVTDRGGGDAMGGTGSGAQLGVMKSRF